MDSYPIPPFLQYHLLWMKTSRWHGWWCSFHLTYDLFDSTLLYSIYFSLPITVYFKNRTFSLCLSRELHKEIWSGRFFFHLTYVEPNIKVVNITELVQMISTLDLDILSMSAIFHVV